MGRDKWSPLTDCAALLVETDLIRKFVAESEEKVRRFLDASQLAVQRLIAERDALLVEEERLRSKKTRAAP